MKTKLRIDIITLFPELFPPFLEWSMIKKAREIKALELVVHNLRKWGIDKRGTVDDHPYGGGPGMILRPEPIFKAIKATARKKKRKIVLLSPKGKTFTQEKARDFSRLNQLVLICGHYEGVDERVRKYMIDEDISIGNYILSGGELAAMVVTDTTSRLLPGVLEKEGASEIESFSPGLAKLLRLSSRKAKNLVEFPQYTRPPVFNGWKVPAVLLSGNHQKIAQWRAKKIKKKKS